MKDLEEKRVTVGSMIMTVDLGDESLAALPGLVIGTVPPDHNRFVILLSNGRVVTRHHAFCTTPRYI